MLRIEKDHSSVPFFVQQFDLECAVVLSFVLYFLLLRGPRPDLSFPLDPAFSGGQDGEFALCQCCREKLIGPEL